MMRLNIGKCLKRRSARVRPLSECLERLLGKSHFGQVLRGCPDRRRLLEFAAAQLGVSPHSLLELVSRHIELPLCRKVPVLNQADLPVGVTIEALLSAGCSVSIEGGKVAQLICCDPACVDWLREIFPEARVSLALWNDIAAALSPIPEAPQTAVSKLGANEQGRVEERCARALEQLLQKVISSGQEEVLIRRVEERVEYRYERGKGSCAVGTFHPALAASLWEYLTRSAREGGSAAVVPPQCAGLRFISNEEEVVLSWRARPESVPERSDTHPENVIPFPAPQSVTEPVARVAAAAVPEQRASTVLLVDDNATFAKVLERFFARHQLETRHAKDGAEALSLLRERTERIDVVVCDVHMPGVSGLEFVQQLRADPAYAELPVVMLTSDTDVEMQLQVLERGADAFVGKNEDPRLLCVHVQRLLMRARSRRAA